MLIALLIGWWNTSGQIFAPPLYRRSSSMSVACAGWRRRLVINDAGAPLSFFFFSDTGNLMWFLQRLQARLSALLLYYGFISVTRVAPPCCCAFTESVDLLLPSSEFLRASWAFMAYFIPFLFVPPWSCCSLVFYHTCHNRGKKLPRSARSFCVLCSRGDI